VLSLQQRKRLPKAREIALAWRTLTAMLPMESVNHGWRESLKGVPNYRIAAITNDRTWSVDVYAGGYYVIMMEGRFPEPCKTLPSLAGYLCRMLQVRRSK
jgi:hypothetical protein